MKDLLVQAKSFFTFDLSVNYDDLSLRFQQTHQKQRSYISGWPPEATYRNLISDYWGMVLKHYLVMLVASIFIIIPLSQFNTLSLSVLVLTGFLVYIPLYFMIYRPTFNKEFMPRLTAVMAEFEGKQQIWAEKCKQEQLSTRGLVLLYYILDKCAEINYLTPSDKSASLLLKIFGVSQKGLKNELDLLFKKEKRAKIEQRKQTEIAKSFEEVYAILEEMQFPKGIQMLKEMEIRFNRPE